MGYTIVPTAGQLQVPGSQQSYARIACQVSANARVTELFTATGSPSAWLPDLGFICWRYVSGGVQRYGRRVPIELTAQILVSDQPQFEFDTLLVVPRPGVTITASLRRVAI